MSKTELQSTHYTTEQMLLIRIPPGIGEDEIDALRLGAERAALALLHGAKKGHRGEFRQQGYDVNLAHLQVHLDDAFERRTDNDSQLPGVYHVAARALFAAALWREDSHG